jgi:hypothetical protein
MKMTEKRATKRDPLNSAFLKGEALPLDPIGHIHHRLVQLSPFVLRPRCDLATRARQLACLGWTSHLSVKALEPPHKP